MTAMFWQLFAAGAATVGTGALLYALEKHTAFGRLKYYLRQVIIGIVFGVLAILATHNGIDAGGAVVNVRDAAPLTAGFVFGAPAGFLSGLIGGVERYIAGIDGVGEFTMIACSVSTVVAGLFAGLIKIKLFDNKKVPWEFGLISGAAVEVFHMVLILVLGSADTIRSYEYMQLCSIPMIAGNAATVAAVLVITRAIRRGGFRRKKVRIRKIAQTFQFWLLIMIAVAFVVTAGFAHLMQTGVAERTTNRQLSMTAEDVKNEIINASDEALYATTRQIMYDVRFVASDDLDLAGVAKRYDVAEINVVDENGIIVDSNIDDYIGFDMASGEQSSAFLPLLDNLEGVSRVIQPYGPITKDPRVKRKYVGVQIPAGGFVQVGYDLSQYRDELEEHFYVSSHFRHIGETGGVIICDPNKYVLSSRDGHVGEYLLGDIWTYINKGENKNMIEASIFGVPSYCRYSYAEGFYIVTYRTIAESMLSRDIAMYMIIFIEALIFTALLIFLYRILKSTVVDNMKRVNESLAEITGGNLDVEVDVRSNQEFAILSDDINRTVGTLKFYIDEAASRIDKELEFAKDIQYSLLPSVSPAFPQRQDFDIYALMNTAREVGGDFFDFYMPESNKLAILIADVSGKGIPAAMFMMTAKTLIKGFVESGDPPETAFAKANEELCSGNDADMFVTAWLGVIDLETGLMSYANAGHNPPLIKKNRESFEYLKDKPNFILAGMSGVKYKRHELQLDPGDIVFLYTDGVTEATAAGNELYGEDRLLKCVSKLEDGGMRELCDGVQDDVDAFVGEADQFDDITMLAFKLRTLEDDHSIRTSASVDSMEAVQRYAEKKLERADISARVANRIKVALDEIYSNVAYYSEAGSCTVEIRTFDDIDVIIKDDGKEYDPTAAAAPDTTLSADERKIGGLGIYMTKNLTKSIEYERKDGFNILHMVFSRSQENRK